MNGIRRIGLVLLVLGLAAAPTPAPGANAPSRTFNAPIDRVWAVTESGLTLKAAGEGRTTVSVEREVYTEERILWMTERKPVQATDQVVEMGVLDAIQKAL